MRHISTPKQIFSLICNCHVFPFIQAYTLHFADFDSLTVIYRMNAHFPDHKFADNFVQGESCLLTLNTAYKACRFEHLCGIRTRILSYNLGR